MNDITRLCVGGPMNGRLFVSQGDRAFDVAVEGGGVLRYEPHTLTVETRRAGVMHYKIFSYGLLPSISDVVALLSVYREGDGLIEYLKASKG